MADSCEHPTLTDKPRKRQSRGSAKEQAKKQRVCSHKTGEDCLCKKKCFEKVSLVERQKLISDFNEKYTTKNQQDGYLSTLITVCDIKRRRPRGGDPTKANPHSHTYMYSVRTKNDGQCHVSKKIVCLKAFISLFGVTKQRVETIRKSLVETGESDQIYVLDF
ncbi:hypothetical protein EB796_005953 [Bugula neritina]|uniref:Uncharacterized protein n=1 Tax=Bugula neritina TaxID=10212 RepID=A0A7J7KCR7_BUGNE|nr:hypothetical protein EB796_005953 [Bugula neritina]